tara:strand:- start:380 stop:514 length:135 start_codon:yes stop_codon:yes gene_type:complete
MKEFYKEARKLVTVLLLRLAMRIMPDGRFKNKFNELIVKELMQF